MLPRRLVDGRCLPATILAALALWSFLRPALAQDLSVSLQGGVDDVAILGWEDQSKNLDLNLDPSANGGDILQVRVSGPGVEVGLLLPTSQLITRINASGFGYGWDTVDASAESEGAGLGAPSPGRHEFIRFPAAQPAGVYQLQATRAAAGAPISVNASFQSRSGIRFGVNVAGQYHPPNQPVTVAGLVFDEETPVVGVTITGTVHALLEQSSGVTLGNWQLQQKTDAGDGRSHYAYKATLQNSASAFTQFRAAARQPDETVELDTAEMWFRDVAQGETKQCSLCFGFTGPSIPEPSPASFPWQILAEPDPIPLTLSDSSPAYPTTGDGVYTGTFTSPYTGDHWVDLKAQGAGPSQRPFNRMAGVTVTIEPRPAYFLGIADSLNDADMDGKPDEIRIVASEKFGTCLSFFQYGRFAEFQPVQIGQSRKSEPGSLGPGHNRRPAYAADSRNPEHAHPLPSDSPAVSPVPSPPPREKIRASPIPSPPLVATIRHTLFNGSNFISPHFSTTYKNRFRTRSPPIRTIRQFAREGSAKPIEEGQTNEESIESAKPISGSRPSPTQEQPTHRHRKSKAQKQND